jgi:type I restriction enzyme, R subunit
MEKLLESEVLKQQAANNTKEQFANSPDLKTELMNAIIGALDAHTAMSSQALESERVREGLKDVLLGPARLYENLRQIRRRMFSTRGRVSPMTKLLFKSLNTPFEQRG